MRLFVLWVELPNVVAVQCPHYSDPREPRRAASATALNYQPTLTSSFGAAVLATFKGL
jgi:hypothetical protein